MVLDPQCQSYVPKSAAVAQPGQVFLQRGMRAALSNPLEPEESSRAPRRNRRWTSPAQYRPARLGARHGQRYPPRRQSISARPAPPMRLISPTRSRHRQALTLRHLFRLINPGDDRTIRQRQGARRILARKYCVCWCCCAARRSPRAGARHKRRAPRRWFRAPRSDDGQSRR